MSLKLYRILLVIFLVWSVASTTLMVYYYSKYQRLSGVLEKLPAKTITVDIGIDYGNGTMVWFNGTILPLKSTVFSAIVSVANVEYRIGSYGAYIIAINGVREKIVSNREGFSWMWYLYNTTTGKLTLGPVAADKYYLSGGEVIIWKYSHWKF
ncbi:MAG TPA: DUF4430 domain-containing protein [Thermoproteales archaeon]|nr:DUF4430 domain-containing protein [Thermoproteales archaeon]